MKHASNYLIAVAIIIIIIGGYIFKTRLSQAQHRTANVNKLQVVTSFYPMSFFASQIGGDKAEVYTITPAGSEPHDYEPTPQDIAKIESSQLLVINGGKLEPWADSVRQNLAGKPVKIVVAGEDLATDQLTEEGRGQDPHVWLSPPLAMKEVATITVAFDQVDPTNKARYDANAKQLTDKLISLDHHYRQGLAHCQQKDIITSHAAFGYLAKAYGFHQMPIAGLSPDAEPSAKELARIADFAKQHDLRYIFFESLVSPKLSETLANEITAKTLVLNPLEGLRDDEMKAGKDYITVMEENLANLKVALQCS